MQELKNFRKYIDADLLDLAEIGWTESRDDNQIKKYVKSFIQNNYERKIDDELALIIVFIIDDLLTDIQRKEVKPNILWHKL
jgi:DNA-directed RNA polymerase subunit E'/Rpb7